MLREQTVVPAPMKLPKLVSLVKLKQFRLIGDIELSSLFGYRS
jgi:hypothetical protein